MEQKDKLIVDEKIYWNEKYWELYHKIEEELKELKYLKKEKEEFK